MIPMEPFPGLGLWYWPGAEDAAGEMGTPLAATVAALLPDGRVTLAVLDGSGRPVTRSPVPFFGPGETPASTPVPRSFCTLRDDHAVAANLAARMENVEAKLSELAPADTSNVGPEDEPAEDEKKRGRKGHR